jgi:predicted porin
MEIGGDLDSKFFHSNSYSLFKFESDLSLDLRLYHVAGGVLKYGLDIRHDLSGQYPRETTYYLFIVGYLGKIEIGTTRDATENLKIGALPLSISPNATGSSFAKHVEFPTGYGNALFEPTTLMNQNFGFTNGQSMEGAWNSTRYLDKISYYSPEFFGFQLGLSITPNISDTLSKNAVFGKLISKSEKTELKDLGCVTSAALNYIGNILDISLAASIAFEFNSRTPTWIIPFKGKKYEKKSSSLAAEFQSWEVGLSLSYFGLTIAGSYGQNITSIEEDLSQKLNLEETIGGGYTTFGASYEIGSFGIGAVFFNSEYNGNTIKTTNYELKRKIAKNLTLYLQFIDYQYKFEIDDEKESGEEFAAAIGLLLNF